MQDLMSPVVGGEIAVWHRSSQGASPTAVLAHGLTGNSRWWARVIDLLPAEIGIAAIDLRGRGGSVDAPPPFDLGTLGDDILTTLDHLELDRAIVVGYSMGAWIAAIFSIAHAERVERLVLVDGGLAMPTDQDQDPDSIIAAMVGPALARLDIDFADEEEFFDYWKAHPALERHWEDEMRAALSHELAPAGDVLRVGVSRGAVRDGARQITVDPETKDVAAQVTVPTTLIVVERGTADQPGGMVPLDVAHRAASSNPNLSVEYLEDLNHYTLVLGRGAAPVAAAIASG